MNKRLLISPFNDPYLNLSLENYLMEHLESDEEILFLYIDDPSVVIGRFQNPWLECTPHRSRDTYLVRRQSGGGTVYHDHGNLNFSFIQNLENYDRMTNLKEICRVMKSCGLDLDINDRHDLTVSHGGSVYKVSGSAFRHKKDRAFHHGTLLISAETGRLKESITPGTLKKFTKASGTESKRSPVINLNRVKEGLTMEAVLDAFRNCFPECSMSTEEWDGLSEHSEVEMERSRLLSEDWILGKTPSFRQDISSLNPPETKGWEISVSKGVISETPPELDFLKGLTYGRRQTPADLAKKTARLSLFGLSGDELLSRLVQFIG
ncbi:MAG: hypothetical protein PQJ50_17045 [Spirochaetales bacterium]|nr:hypothetical protein [Spirochaetales bacterium]